MISSDRVLDFMEQLGITYTLYTHPPVSSAAERVPMGLTYGATVCKNLLVTTRNENRFLLLMLPYEKTADLKAVRSAFGTTRLGFASDDTLLRLLGEKPGTVGVSGLIDDTAHAVEVVFDSALKNAPLVAMHPGDNSKTVVLSFSDIERFTRACGAKIYFFDFKETSN